MNTWNNGMMKYWNNGEHTEENRPCRVAIAHLTPLMRAKGHFKCLWLGIIVFTFVFSVTSPATCGEQQIFSTWDVFEADNLASIWLIKRFIAPGASIVLYPKGQLITEGISFDTPNAQIARAFNKSTFEAFLDRYRIKDRKLINIGKLIHDTEINIWEKKLFKRTREVEIRVVEILEKYKKNEEIIAKACEYFDNLYSTMPAELQQN